MYLFSPTLICPMNLSKLVRGGVATKWYLYCAISLPKCSFSKLFNWKVLSSFRMSLSSYNLTADQNISNNLTADQNIRSTSTVDWDASKIGALFLVSKNKLQLFQFMEQIKWFGKGEFTALPTEWLPSRSRPRYAIHHANVTMVSTVANLAPTFLKKQPWLENNCTSSSLLLPHLNFAFPIRYSSKTASFNPASFIWCSGWQVI